VKQHTLHFTYRGQIERGTGGPGYKWMDGYSLTGAKGEVFYPWMTRRECQQSAARIGCTAVFIGRLDAQPASRGNNGNIHSQA
jgi:hypothetical protein